VVSDFHLAVGQVMNYRLILQRDEPDRVLYLAVPLDVYETFFKLEFTQLAIATYQFKIIVYNTEDEVVLQWIN
jgi:XisH protein